MSCTSAARYDTPLVVTPTPTANGFAIDDDGNAVANLDAPNAYTIYASVKAAATTLEAVTGLQESAITLLQCTARYSLSLWRDLNKAGVRVGFDTYSCEVFSVIAEPSFGRPSEIAFKIRYTTGDQSEASR